MRDDIVRRLKGKPFRTKRLTFTDEQVKAFNNLFTGATTMNQPTAQPTMQYNIDTLPNGQPCIRRTGGALVCTMEAGYGPTRGIDAAHIVHCVNTYPALLAALKNVALIAKNLKEYGEVDAYISHDLKLLVAPAIAQAEGSATL